MKRSAIIFPVFFLIFLCAFPVSAQQDAQQEKKGYVSDMLLLTVRKGPGKQYNVIRTIRSDTPVYILEEQDSYARVRLEDGTTGWVESQYITFESPKSMVIARLQARVEQLQGRVKELSGEKEPLENQIEKLKANYEERIQTLQAELETVKKEKAEAESKLNRLEKKHSDLVEKSGSVTQAFQENRQLKEKTKALSAKLEALEKENDDLLKTGMIKWFLAGAGVLLLGWLVGKSISKSRRKSSGSLLG